MESRKWDNDLLMMHPAQRNRAIEDNAWPMETMIPEEIPARPVMNIAAEVMFMCEMEDNAMRIL